jgi:hypothetical protein
MPIVAGTGARVAYGLLDLVGDLEVVRPGQPVRDDRALQGHHRTAAGQGRRHVGPVPESKVAHAVTPMLAE